MSVAGVVLMGVPWLLLMQFDPTGYSGPGILKITPTICLVMSRYRLIFKRDSEAQVH